MSKYELSLMTHQLKLDNKHLYIVIMPRHWEIQEQSIVKWT